MEGAEEIVRVAELSDAPLIGQLLHDFNREFEETTPPPPVLAERIRRLLRGGDTVVVLGGQGPDGVAVLRFREAIWTEGFECYLAELYVVPEHRGRGLGREILSAAIGIARGRGARSMEIGVDEPDIAARRLYESAGFTNRAGGGTGALMFVYEREL